MCTQRWSKPPPGNSEIHFTDGQTWFITWRNKERMGTHAGRTHPRKQAERRWPEPHPESTPHDSSHRTTQSDRNRPVPGGVPTCMLSTVWLFSTPLNSSLPGFSCLWDFPGKNTGVCRHFLLQGSFRPRDWTCISCLLQQQADSLPLEEGHLEILWSWSLTICVLVTEICARQHQLASTH